MKTNRSETWEKIVTAGEKAAAAYRDLVAAADELADVLEYNSSYVLPRVLPRTPADRRNSRRILDWLNDNREGFEAHVLARQAEQAEEARREALLAKLNLTADEQRLLGIDGR